MALMLVILFILLHVNGFNDNWDKCGVCQQWDNESGDYSGLKTWDPHFFWSNLEPKDNEWDFSSVDTAINDAIKKHPNINFVLNPLTGGDAPKWIYNAPWNVPAVYMEGDNNKTDPWPYYLDQNYSVLFKRYIDNVYYYINNQSKSIRSKLFACQAMFGSTGDDTPWHGTPQNKQYDISAEEWWQDIDKPFATYMYNLYKQTFPDLLILYNFGENVTRINWLMNNLAGCYRKEGMVSHGYQLNSEQSDYYSIGNGNQSIFIKQNNITIRYRGELSGNSMDAGAWEQAPLWNSYSLIEWSLTFGIDMLNYHTNMLNNNSYFSMFNFQNLYGGLKTNDADKSIGAWIHLRDGLDSNDINRFPESIYGQNTDQNAQRMVNIANAFKDFGAKQEDPSSACGGPMNQRHAKKLNDVGWNIWSTNYGQYIQQINPLNTSIGYWRVGDINQIYGRFARGFDYKNNLNQICFVLNKKLWNGLPLKSNNNLTVEIVYFDNYDNNKNLFSFGYDNNQNNLCSFNKSIIIKSTNTNRWITKLININDAYFGNRCSMKSDFCLYNQAQQNAIFSFIHIYNKLN